MDPDRDQDRRLSSQAVTASDLEVGQPDISRPSTPLSIMEDREKIDEQAVRDIADPVMKAMFLAAVLTDKDQDQDGEALKASVLVHTVFTRITGTLYSKGHFGLT